MKDTCWKDCLEQNNAIERSVDRLKAKSLMDTASSRIEFLENNEITEKNASFIFEGYYSSISEYLHAVLVLRGFKVNNHICLGFYVRDELGNESLFRKFDDLRFKRNGLLYYGKNMDFEIAKETIFISKEVIEELKGIIENGN